MANTLSVSAAAQTANSQLSSMSSAMNGFVQELQSVAASAMEFTPTAYQNEYYIDPTVADPVVSAAANSPVVSSFPQDTVQRPADPSFSAITIPDFGSVPELILAEPVITVPSAPDATLPASPGNAPEINSAVLPAAPAITLPAVPTIQALALPEAPSITLPTLQASMPTDDMLEPTSAFAFNEEEYSSELLDAARIKLMDDLVNGGYGIEVEDEERLWARARERELRNAETAIQEAARQTAARGMLLPPGALNAAVARIQAEALEKTSSLQRDIAIKRADMYVENRKFTLQQVQQTEAMLIQYFGFAQERALNAAKYMAEFGVQLFNAKLARFNARVEAMRGAAQLFDAQLRAALANLDVYKAKVEGARLTVETQQLYVQLYNEQLKGVQSTVDLYKTQMEAAKVYTAVEMSKLDLFRARVEAYQAQVGAKNAEFGMYESRVRGEMAKVSLYEASVRAYATKVNAYESGVRAKETIVKAQVAAASLPLEQYRAKIQMYGADVQRYNSNVSAALGLNDFFLRRYGIKVDAVAKATSEKVAAHVANANTLAHQAQIAVTEVLGQAQAINARAQIAATAAAQGLNALSSNMQALASQASAMAVEIQSA